MKKSMARFLIRLKRLRNALRPLGKEGPGDTSQAPEESFLLKLRLRDIMVPRSDIVSVDHNASLQAVHQLLLTTQFEALPVFQETLDRIVGLIDCHGILKVLGEQSENWEVEMKPVFFAASSMTILEAVLEMQKRDTPFILIVDEYGGIDGLVARDTILMALLHHLKPLDEPHETEATFYREDGMPLVDARLNLEEFRDMLGASAPPWKEALEEGIETVGGLVCHLAGRVPLKGEVIADPSGLTFEILDAEPRKIKRLSVRLPAIRSGAA
jgi:CBS domain containing-hemolysin-like protein